MNKPVNSTQISFFKKFAKIQKKETDTKNVTGPTVSVSRKVDKIV